MDFQTMTAVGWIAAIMVGIIAVVLAACWYNTNKTNKKVLTILFIDMLAIKGNIVLDEETKTDMLVDVLFRKKEVTLSDFEKLFSSLSLAELGAVKIPMLREDIYGMKEAVGEVLLAEVEKKKKIRIDLGLE
jgi:hypothetical protein